MYKHIYTIIHIQYIHFIFYCINTYTININIRNNCVRVY